MIRNLVVVAAVLAGLASGGAGIAKAQYNERFQREAASLRVEAAQLRGRQVDLQLRFDANKQVAANLKSRGQEINAMPPGIGRDAAVQQFNRDRDAYFAKRDQLNLDVQKFKDAAASYSDRKRSHDRRVQAAKDANEYRPGESVQVNWRGDWWRATVLRAENGSYYITYPGYGSEWNEWVGSDRIRR